MSSSLFGALNCCLLSPHGCPFAVGSEFFNLLMFHLHVFYPYLEDSFGLTINQFIVHPHVPGRLSLIRQVNSFKGGLDPNLSPADDSAGGPGEGPGGGGQGRAKGGPGSCQGASFSSFTTSWPRSRSRPTRRILAASAEHGSETSFRMRSPIINPTFWCFAHFSPKKRKEIGWSEIFLPPFTMVYHICRWSWYDMGTRFSSESVQMLPDHERWPSPSDWFHRWWCKASPGWTANQAILMLKMNTRHLIHLFIYLFICSKMQQYHAISMYSISIYIHYVFVNWVL